MNDQYQSSLINNEEKSLISNTKSEIPSSYSNSLDHELCQSSLFEFLFGSCFSLSSDALTPDELRKFRDFVERTNEKLNIKEHIRLFSGLWHTLFGYNEEISNILDNENWKKIGFQNKNPVSDIRSGGLLAVQNLLEFAEEEKKLVWEMSEEKHEFFWAITSINITEFIKVFFHAVQGPCRKDCSEKCNRKQLKIFCKWLGKDREIVQKIHSLLLKDIFYCWLYKKNRDKTLNIMRFNEVFKSVKKSFAFIVGLEGDKGFKAFEKSFETRTLTFKNNI